MSFTESLLSEGSTPATSISSSIVGDIVLKGSGLDDKHNTAELDKLVSYILREANEKARELQIRVSCIHSPTLNLARAKEKKKTDFC